MKKPWVKGGSKKGRKLTEETRKRMSISRIGHPVSESTKEKIRLSKLGKHRPDMIGENNPVWNPNRQEVMNNIRRINLDEHKIWSKAVKKRDNWRCRISNEECKGGLESHHILSYSKHPDLRYEISNGITLCHFHHPRSSKVVENMASYFQNMIKKQNA